MNTSILICWPPTSFRRIIICSIALISLTSILAAGDEVVGGENLVSHGTNTQGQNECWASYNDTSQTGYGPGYQNNCIHSDSNNYSGGNTVWYNYVTASAGVITDENTDSEHLASNTNTATESVCPRGWSLPTTKQIDSNRDIASFNPVLGGYYSNSALSTESTRGSWWGNEAYNGASRYELYYNDSNKLFTGNNDRGRSTGRYIRCVSEEKAITSLTYMQDMTSVAV